MVKDRLTRKNCGVTAVLVTPNATLLKNSLAIREKVAYTQLAKRFAKGFDDDAGYD
jgi:hypothetical protein